jgi:hypothetical protein
MIHEEIANCLHATTTTSASVTLSIIDPILTFLPLCGRGTTESFKTVTALGRACSSGSGSYTAAFRNLNRKKDLFALLICRRRRHRKTAALQHLISSLRTFRLFAQLLSLCCCSRQQIKQIQPSHLCIILGILLHHSPSLAWAAFFSEDKNNIHSSPAVSPN